MRRARFVYYLIAALDGEYGDRIQAHVLGRYILAPLLPPLSGPEAQA